MVEIPELKEGLDIQLPWFGVFLVISSTLILEVVTVEIHIPLSCPRAPVLLHPSASEAPVHRGEV